MFAEEYLTRICAGESLALDPWRFVDKAQAIAEFAWRPVPARRSANRGQRCGPSGPTNLQRPAGFSQNL